MDRDRLRTRVVPLLAIAGASALIAPLWMLARADRIAVPGGDATPTEVTTADALAAGPGAETGAEPDAAARAAVRSAADDRAWTVFGMVRDGETGEPVAAARVELRHAATRLGDTPGALRTIGVTETDGAGRYRLAVPELRALSAADLQRSVIEACATSPAHPRAQWETGEATECPDGLRLDLEALPFAGLFGRVVDPAGHAIAEARVLCAALDGAFDSEWIESESDGRYWLSLDESAPHRCVLAADHAAFGHAAPVQVATVPGRAHAVPDLVLERSTGVITGTVRFADGTPVDGLHLRVSRVVPEDDDEPDDAAPSSPLQEIEAALGHHEDGTMRSDERGRFAFRGLQPGDYELTTEPYDGDAGLDELFPPRTLPTGGADAAIEVRHARIRWRLRDHRGHALFDASVNFEYWPPPHAAAARRAFDAGLPIADELRRRAGGGFVGARPDQLARTWVPWGTFAAIEVFDSEHAPHRRGILAPAGAGDIAVDVRLEALQQPGRLRIRVVDPDGIPLPEYSWRVHRGDLHSTTVALAPGQPPGAWMPAPAGGSTPPLPPGRLVLELRPGADARARSPLSFLTEHRALDLRPSTELPVEIHARRAAEVWLHVRRLGGPGGERLLQYRCAVRAEPDGREVVLRLGGEGTPRRDGLVPLRLGEATALRVLHSFAPGDYHLTVDAWERGGESYGSGPIRLALVGGANRIDVDLRLNR